VEQDFKKLWSSYIKILKQRNEALKTKDSSENMWVEKLASAGEEISTMREKYVSRLQTKLNETGNYIMPNQELNFVYERGWNEKMSLIESLKEKAQLDSDRGFTSVGPQNANIKIMLNGHEAQKVCSRGQQKLIANIMLLSQSKDFYEKRNFPNIILVDDLSAELTLEMQEKILERLFESKSQVFLTALNDSVLADILYEMDTNVFHVEHGEIA
jgi:DNA replication and repair protein RecF